MKHSFLMHVDGGLLTTADLPERERFSYWRDLVFSEFGGLDLDSLPDYRHSFNGRMHGREIKDFSLNEAASDQLFIERSPRQIRKSSADDLKLIVPLSGSPFVKQGSNASLMGEGDMVLFDSSRPYSLEFAGDYHALIIQLPRRILADARLSPNAFGRVIPSVQGIGSLLNQQLRGLYQELENLDASTKLFMIENVTELLKRSLGVSTEDREAADFALDSALLGRAKKLIELNLDNGELSPGYIASAMGISVRYVHRLFEPAGLSFSRYVIKQRLERAERLLADPRKNHYNITQIALMAGFSDSAHFSRSFKKRFEYSPKDYRQKCLLRTLAPEIF